MRSIPHVGGLIFALALSLALGGRSSADPVPYSAPVVVAEAEVRSGPTTDPKFYSTNRLRRGDVVQVVKERPDGWLEIRPPQGSFSWINTRYVTQPVPTQPNNFVVMTPGGVRVSVLMGGELGQGRPTVEAAKLEQGTMVYRYTKTGETTRVASDTDGTWMPIDPPAAEVRYLRAEAVGKAPAPAAAAPAPVPVPAAVPQAVANPAANPAAIGASSFTPTSVAPGAVGVQAGVIPASSDKPTHAEVEDLYNRAVAADRAGNVQLAAQLYYKAASMGLAINSPICPQALGRANYLLGIVPPASSPVTDSRLRPMTPEPVTPPVVRLAQPCTPAVPPDQPLSTAGATFTTSRQQGDMLSTPQWVGRLRRAGRGIGNRPTYVLESSTGAPLLYANPVVGVELDSFIGQNVQLIGTTTYYGELRAQYMWVTQVRQVP
jgi:hypothetical protein